jgi:two-component system LytT family response regulator
MIRALIVDDEALARERIRSMLEKETRVEVVGECTNGLEALAAIQEHRPQLVFLDVQMPELDGFEVLENLGPDQRPQVIFITAHDRFACKAFEVHAIDYLLKPFNKTRFQTALNRALERIQQGQTDKVDRQVSELLAEVRPEKPLDRLAVKSGGRVVLIRLEEIDYIEAASNYVELHVGRESHLLRETMNKIEGRLPPAKFLRISRSTIVQIDRIKELQPLFHGEYSVILRDGTKLTLSRSYRDKLPLLGLT